MSTDGDGHTSAMVMVVDTLAEPLLSAEDEVELARGVEAGLLAREARLAGSTPNGATEFELLELEELGERARQRYIRANLRLVAKLARQAAARSNLTESDLFQEGCLGLICAVERYDHRLGYRFSTYASFWIRASLGAATATKLGALNLPASRAAEARRVRGVEVELTQSYGRTVTAAEVAAGAGRSEQSTADLLALQVPQSLDAIDVNLLGLAQPSAVDAPSHDRPGRELLWHLEAPERDVMALRYGFADGGVHTYTQISERLGITISRARRLEDRGLEALRSVCPNSARVHL